MGEAAVKCRHCGEIIDEAFAAKRRLEAIASAPLEKGWNKGIAMVLSLLLPGAGQIYKGDVLLGFLWLFLVGIFYGVFLESGLPLALAIAGVIHFACVLMAALGDPYEAAKRDRAKLLR